VSCLLISLRRLISPAFPLLQRLILSWTTPLHSSLLPGTVLDLARGKSELVAENALLRQHLIILRRQITRPRFRHTDRILLVLLARAVRTWRQTLLIVQPETLLMWHRQGFRLFWRHKSKARSTQAKMAAETISLIQEMARNNRLWGAERIRGELLKLGIHVCTRTIQKYMRHARAPRSRGQSWATFLRTLAGEISGVWGLRFPAPH
jgi:putative transposase